MYPVELRGTQVRLRDVRAADEDGLLAIVGDDTVTRWLSFDSRSRDDVRGMLSAAAERSTRDPREDYYLGVVEPATDDLVGLAMLSLAGVKAGKLGYAVRAASWGRGYATDAARTLVDFGFQKVGLHRISAAIGPDNTASLAVVERLGFQYEGRIRDHVFTNGGWRDSLLYSVLENDWS